MNSDHAVSAASAKVRELMPWTSQAPWIIRRSLPRVLATWALALSAAGVGQAQQPGPSAGPSGPPARQAPAPSIAQPGRYTGQPAADYKVGPNDVLNITVFDQPQLTGRYMIQADGSFTFPLLGRVSVGGLTMQAVEAHVRDSLAKGYLKNPQVGVSVEEFRSQQVFIVGEVRQPGILQFTGSMTMIEALARAGSTTDRAGVEAVVVRTPDGASPPDAATLARARKGDDANVIRVNLETLQNGALTQNVTLQSGDTIFVPRAETVFVSGQVYRPGEYPIRAGMTVRQLLALAGGVTDRGSTRRIQIIREIDSKETTISADQQDTVRGGDTILVRERFF
jgi:polysaccharide export outer membrane protein